ncbi:MAG: prepilin peptidase [Cyanobacteriota bacterium]|jgi:leader peptidase (prepilin peptidase)/N-methyltransferase
MASLMPLAPALITALLGAAVGSFLNVVTWRLPRQESILWPSSHCPRCGTTLAWSDNVPVLSWLLLRGRCRYCKAPISRRYPLVESACALLWVITLLAQPAAMGPAPDALLLLLAGWILVSWLIPLVLIDLDSLWLPEPLCRWGLVTGLAVTALLGFQQGPTIGRSLLFSHLLAAAIGLLGFELCSALAARAFGKPALGLGDAKLAAMMGAWLGPLGLGLAVALAVICGGLIGLLGRLTGRLRRGQAMAFGPFLAAGTLAVWWAGSRFWLDLLLPRP